MTRVNTTANYDISAQNYDPANSSSVRAAAQPQTASSSSGATTVYGSNAPGTGDFTCPAPGDYYIWCGATNSLGANCTGNPWCEWEPNPPSGQTCSPSINCLNNTLGTSPNDVDTLKCYPWPTCEIISMDISGNSVTIAACATMSAIFTTLCFDSFMRQATHHEQEKIKQALKGYFSTQELV